PVRERPALRVTQRLCIWRNEACWIRQLSEVRVLPIPATQKGTAPTRRQDCCSSLESPREGRRRVLANAGAGTRVLDRSRVASRCGLVLALLPDSLQVLLVDSRLRPRRRLQWLPIARP